MKAPAVFTTAQRAPQLSSFAIAAGLGAAVGLGLFIVEGAMVLGSGAVGLQLPTDGPFAALFAAVRPLLPSLLGRVLVVYLVGGAAVGLGAGTLAQVFGARSRLRFAVLTVAELAVLWALLGWHHMVLRPALFDDVRWLRVPLEWAVSVGQPWHARAVAVGWAGVHALVLARRWRGAFDRVTGAIAASLVVLLGSSVRTAPAASGPLFVLVGLDAFRTDRLQAFGAKGGVAPNLDAFTRDATVFTRAYTPIAQTEPAWRSLLTARWPFVAGSRYPLTAEARWAQLPTVASQFSLSGYSSTFETDCSRFNFQPESSGFSTRRQPPRGAINFALEKLRFRVLGLVADNAVGAWWLPELIDNRAVAGLYDPQGYGDRLAARLVAAADRGPTLFAFHGTAAHFPGDPTWPHYRRFVAEAAPFERRLRMVFTPIASGAVVGSPGWGRPESEALYDELLAQADQQLGQLLDALKAAGLYEQAFIVVFSDHGESFHADVPELAGATPVHGARLTREENQIVLAIKPAHGRTVATVDSLVRLIDIGPTLLDAAHLPPLPAADGRSLVPLLEGHRLPEAWLYAETGFTHASPVAFDPGHSGTAPRTFEAYQVRPDGVVEMTDQAHAAVLAEKDVGAFDGERWLVRSPRTDGTTLERCDGDCEALRQFLTLTLKETAP